MKDIQAIIEVCRNQDAEQAPLALATVVKVEGSAYRRPGARMLVTAEGRRIGSISGGCLEADVALHAQEVMATGEPRVILYDTRVSNGDLLFELGCKGAIGILIEPVSRPEVFRSLEFLASFLQERGQGAQATVFRVEGEGPVTVGARLMRNAQGSVCGRLGDAGLDAAIAEDFAGVSESGQAKTQTYITQQGRVEALLEPVQSPVALLLYGAGQDAVPLAQMARFLGWQVTVADYRPSMLSPERFPGAATLLASGPHALNANFLPDARTAVVLMSHSYANDMEWLQHLLPLPLGYLGMLGPRKRAEQMRNDLRGEGVALDEERLTHLYSPAGLDIGSETPEEIALAILAEIQAVLAERAGGFLRERKGPIHVPSQQLVNATNAFPLPVMPCPLSA